MFRLLIVLSCALVALGQLAEEAHPAPEPYSFAFSSPNDDGTSSSRQETGDANGRVSGSYTIQGADGQQRRVEYVADENGFRANVITNEIGTESQNTADVQFQSSAPTAAELTAQWEASGAGRARLAAPQQALVQPAIGLARPTGLVQAPIAPNVGGLVGGQILRLDQGLRAPAVRPIAAPVAIAAPAAPVALAPAAPIGAPIGASIAPVSFAGRIAPFRGFQNLIRTQRISPVAGVSGISNLGAFNQLSLGASQLGVQQLRGVSPLGLQHLGLGLRGANLGVNLEDQHNGNLLLLSGAAQQPISPIGERNVEVKAEALGRKY